MTWQRKIVESGDFIDHLVGWKDSKIWTKNHGEYSIHTSSCNLIGYYSSAVTRMVFMNCENIKKGNL